MARRLHLARLEERLGEAPAIEVARSGLRDVADRAWLVGGAVRDAALGADVVDVDIAFDGDPSEAARRIAADGEGHPFELSGEFATWRVVARDGGWKVDVAALRGPSIEVDLRLRDFTVNAVAVPLAGGEPLDPAGGLGDLERGTLRACADRAFADDPLRVLRAARFLARAGFAPEPHTAGLARAEASRAGEPAGERQYAELRLLLAGADPLAGIGFLDEVGALAAVVPEVAALHGVSQSANHHLDAYEHTLEVLRRMQEVERDLPRYCGEGAAAIAERLAAPLADELDRGDALRWAALLHDIGKPATRRESGGRVSFIGHDATGAQLVAGLCRRLRTSRRFATHLGAMTRDHLVLGFMVRERPLPRRRVWDYLSRTAPQTVDTTLLTIADRLSAQGGDVPGEAIAGHLELAREMLAAAIAWEDEDPDPLLRGDEIAAEVGIEPGPRLGAAVAELAAARFAGEVGDRAAALAHLRAWADRR
ncbi:MAG: HD domain-containing protein [Thermoleophilia bacterium]|nr:HD domain-containing protein [Thermoleophilia bacterium]GIK77507.1 MAG: tRNA nucleotidyltransferase [Actinomycetes bacterium]